MGEAGPPRRVLVVDDEESMRYFVRRGLERQGFAAEAAASGAGALEAYGARPAEVVVLDLKMPGMDGLEVLRALRRQDPEAVVVLMTAYGTIATAVEAMRAGAFDFVTKPFEIDELAIALERALEHRAMRRENRELRRLVDHRTAYASLIGQSPAMKAVFQAIDLLRDNDATVLVTGESGTGKELVARAIHMSSLRAEGPFVPLHCAALPDNLLENELFGHEVGAYTGATEARPGLLARADGGTLFLDEVAEIHPAAQAKLERFIQEKEYVPLGGQETRKVDVRIVAATNVDLERASAAGRFRQELFWRLNVVPVHLPPLRDRREDVPALVDHYLERFAEPHGRRRRLSIDAMLVMTRYDWPGNVRELQNAVERIAVLAGDREVIEADDLPPELRGAGVMRRGRRAAEDAPSFHAAVTAFEREYLESLFERAAGNVSEAARLAGLSRGHLHRKIKQLDLDPERFR